MIDLLRVFRGASDVEPRADNLTVKTQEFLCKTFAEAFERVVNGDGLAVIDSVGLSNFERLTLHTNIVEDTTQSMSTKSNNPGILFCKLQDKYLEILGNKFLSPESNPFLTEDYIAVMGMYNMYGLAGEASFFPHYDFGIFSSFTDEEPADLTELITVVYTNSGNKCLHVWPAGEDETSSDGFLIEQKTDNAIFLRGGSTTLKPAIRHGVPATTAVCNIVSFEIEPKRLSN